MFLQTLTQIIFPKSCLKCNKIIINGLFCTNCWKEIEFITEPFCQICHFPFEYKLDNNSLCASCSVKKPTYNKLITAVKYNEIISYLIGRFKFFDQTYMAKNLYQLIEPKLQEFINEIDIICAVPLDRTRLKKRKYNQSLLLSKFIAKKYNIKLVGDLLIRIKKGRYQIGLNKNARINNVKNAFIVNEKYLSLIKDKNILLIDDVVTTGATIDNCSKVLNKNCKNIFAAAIAKRMLK